MDGSNNKSGRQRKPGSVLSEPVYDALKARIMDQTVDPGAKLNIDGLAEEMGTSPTPVRESLARLAAERLVSFTPYKGYSVMPLLSQRDLADLMHVRRLLEVDAARLAATRIIIADLRTMRGSLELMTADEPEPVFGAYRDYNEHDRIFHETMISASGNSVLLDTYRMLHMHTLLARLYHDRGEVDYLESIQEHHAIVNALSSREVEATACAVRNHIDGVELRLGDILDKQHERSRGTKSANDDRLLTTAEGADAP